MAGLGLCCCGQAFSSLGKWGLRSGCGAQASHHSGFPCGGARALGVRASAAEARQLRGQSTRD